MANVIKLRKGLDVNLKGKASLETMQTKVEGQYALVPDDFCGMKPKVVVKEGDAVKVGDALFVDKNHPEVKFVSPVSGTVALVERGERRKVMSVRVDADGKQTAASFTEKEPLKLLLVKPKLPLLLPKHQLMPLMYHLIMALSQKKKHQKNQLNNYKTSEFAISLPRNAWRAFSLFSLLPFQA